MEGNQLLELLINYGIAGITIYILYRISEDKLEKLLQIMMEVKALQERILEELRKINDRR